MTSPITTEWLGLPADIRSAAETAVGHLRWPLTHADVLLRVGRAIKAERERCAEYHDDLAAQHDACEYESDYHVMMARSHGTFAAAIRRGYRAPPSPKPAAVSEGGEDE